MMTVTYRADVVGSLLGPSELHRAREECRDGAISRTELKRIEDAAVTEVITMQEDAGVDVVTDGELRRTHFAGPLIDACDGFEDKPAPLRRYFSSAGEEFLNDTPRSVTAPLRLRRALVTEEFTFGRARSDRPVKATLPAPTNIAMFWSPEHSVEAYPDPFDLFADAAEILRLEIDELARLGCGYVQLDAPELAALVDDEVREHNARLGIDPDRLLDAGIELLNDLAARSDVQFALHLCKGSKYRGWGAAGGYDAIASRVFSRATNFDAFLLEYDDDRSGSFAPLRAVPDDKVVVLGLVSTRRPELEPLELLEARVAEAARFFPRAQLAISTQCGFASGLKASAEDLAFQRAKLTLVGTAARALWPS
jgi:5-methyltetrahydropteroyltriglutamate--homocysteine methyltransferase